MSRPSTPPRWLVAPVNAGLVLALVVCLLGLCHVAFSGADGDHLDSSTTAAVAQHTEPGGAVDLGSSLHDSSEGGAAVDCALLITCTIALLALGGLLALRTPRTDRVLWRRPAPARRRDGVTSVHVHRPAFVREPAALVC